MSDHTETHEHAEKALDEMQDQSESLKGDIKGAKEDWESKKADDGVPGAGGSPQEADSGEEPEADYPTKSSSEDVER